MSDSETATSPLKATATDLEAARQLLYAHIERFAAYHGQKENMTWAVATLYVLATAVLVGIGQTPFWRDAPTPTFWLFFVVLVLTVAVAFVFIVSQFERRTAAHFLVHACSNLANEVASRSADCRGAGLG